MSDSEAVVEKRRGRPAKDKSEVIICYSFKNIRYLNVYYDYCFILLEYI